MKGDVRLDTSPQTTKTPVQTWLLRTVRLLICILAGYVLYNSETPRRLLSGAQLGTLNTNTRHRAIKILEQSPLIDGHNDLAILVTSKYANHIYGENFTHDFTKGGFPGHVDVPRISKGHYGGAFWSAFLPCQKDIFDFSDDAYLHTVKATVTQLDLMHRMLERFPSVFPDEPTSDVKSATKTFKSNKMISPLIIEGLHQIGNSISNLRMYYKLGVRYATLNWNCHNIYSDAAVLTFNNNFSSKAAEPYHGGLSKQGRGLVLEMNRMGMIVDLSHVSPDTMRDVLVGDHNKDYPIEDDRPWNGSIAPPLFSHSSVKAICPHPRNVPDDVLEMVKKRNSLVMINFSPDFISCTAPGPDAEEGALPDFDPTNNTIDQVVRHITYVGDKIGYDHVGIGTDFDGIEQVPVGMEDVSKFPDLIAALLDRGVSEKNVKKVTGQNLLRVWKEVEDVASRMQKHGALPLEDELTGWFPFETREKMDAFNAA